MAERPSEQLTDETGLDPIARSAGAESPIEKYGDYEAADERMNGAEAPEETEHIKAQIEETRSQMGETIDAIQERLSFANVSEQVSEQFSNAIESAKDTIYDATLGKVVYFMKNLSDDISDTKFIRTVQSNPFPVVLIGLGAGLLAYQSFGKSKKRPIRGLGRFESEGSITDHKASDRSRAGSYTGSTADGLRDTAGSAYSSVSDAAGTAYSSVTDAAGSAYENVSGKVAEAYSGAGDALNRAYESAGEYGLKAQQKYEYYIEENPLAVGAVAAALGAAVALAFPSTRYEGQLMGEARQNLVDKAQNAAGDLVEKAKHVAGEAGQTIKDEAKALAQ